MIDIDDCENDILLGENNNENIITRQSLNLKDSKSEKNCKKTKSVS